MNSVRERLPQGFLQRMQEQLGEEFEDFMACYDEAPSAGIRINTGRISAEDAAGRLPFAGEPIPWTKNGFYIDRDAAASRHPYYYAGLYYIQEPSAMLPAGRLPIAPGDKVLDLCAAPGGKATELASRLNGTGLLVANDASASRAKALVKNLTVWGAANICITAEQPQRLLDTFGCYFDKILVDAPCSGEGMFRKDPGLIASWEKKGPEEYVPLQKEILSCAVRMLRPGGMLLYSTCTFSEEEDEEVIADALENFPELELVLPDKGMGFSDGILLSSQEAAGGSTKNEYPAEELLKNEQASALNLKHCMRIYPHLVRGEGHFLALLRKQTSEQNAAEPDHLKSEKNLDRGQKKARQDFPVPDAAAEFLRRISETLQISTQSRNGSAVRERLAYVLNEYQYRQIGEQCYLVPPYRVPGGIRYLRTGLLLGTLKRGRFEPSQALAMVLDASCFDAVLDLSCDDERVIRYLKGETLELRDEEAADLGQCLSKTVLICVDGQGLGWGRLADGSVRNKFYPGWRMQ